MIFVNYKAYQEGVGDSAFDLSQKIANLSVKNNINIIPAVSSLDLYRIATSLNLSVWAQHVDPIYPGAYTGFVSPFALSKSHASGVFINHSEHRVSDNNRYDIGFTINECRNYGIETLLFASSIDELSKLIEHKPDYISFEPPEYIGRTDISVATGKPEEILKASEISQKANIPLIVGAGIHNKSDVKKCLELGASGIVVSSDILKSIDQEKELEDLIFYFKNRK